VAVGVATALNPGITVAYGPERPWYSQWFNLRQQLDAVEQACRPNSYRGNAPIKLALENFFIQCYHFGEWLWDDRSTGLSEGEVLAYLDLHECLKVSQGFANTAKHRTRNKPEQMMAIVSSVSCNDAGGHAVVAWKEDGLTDSKDATVLARQCVVAWEGFLRLHRLESPV
jgi:hypothetical protein